LWCGARGLKIVGMTADRILTLRLRPHADRQLIGGSLCDEQGNEHPFTGWLGLLTLLEQVRLAGAHAAQHAAAEAATSTTPSSEQGA
jgi:hypothetical protein